MEDNNLGSLTRMEDIERKLEDTIILSEKLLQKDPGNVIYQSLVVTNLNSLASLFHYIGQDEKARRNI